MALTKVNYVDGVTTIMAKNLNDIQNEVIANGTAIASQATEIFGKADASALAAETAARVAADTALSGEVDDLKSASEQTAESLGVPTVNLLGSYTNNYYWKSNDSSGKAIETSGGTAYNMFAPIEVVAGKKYYYNINSGGSSSQKPVLIVDADFNILTAVPIASNQFVSGVITAPENSKYALLTAYFSDGKNIGMVKFAQCRFYEVTDKPFATSGYFAGKKMSVMGDSFSSFQGDIPSTNSALYTGHIYGVDNAQQMWYNVLANDLGMTPLIINGWSGSCVTSGVRSDSVYLPASSADRCGNMQSDSSTPDIIVIAMGLNDYTYMESADKFGTWDGTTALGTEADLSDYDTATFKTAYATMLARLQHNYPSATIFCVTPWFSLRGATDTGVTKLNAIGKTEKDYADAIMEIASIMGCYVLDSNVGFNRWNYYPTYAQDSSATPTHPNAKGHSVIGHGLARQMLKFNYLE